MPALNSPPATATSTSRSLAVRSCECSGFGSSGRADVGPARVQVTRTPLAVISQERDGPEAGLCGQQGVPLPAEQLRPVRLVAGLHREAEGNPLEPKPSPVVPAHRGL